MAATPIKIQLKGGHVKPVWAGHPWIFPQGIERIEGSPGPGQDVVVFDAQGNALGRGFYSPNSAIAIRLYTRNAEEELSQELLEARFQAAERRRQSAGLNSTSQNLTGYRAIHSEGDFLPGLIVDRFGDVLVVQFGTKGMADRRELILDALEKVWAPRAILDRSNQKEADREGFQLQQGVVRGEVPAHLEAEENGLLLRLPIEGQKTGYYFDQRPLRQRIARLASGKSVLDAYSFVGAIGLQAKQAGAKDVLCVDSSAAALEAGKSLAQLNHLEVRFQKADAKEFLLSQSPTWDIVIADPPKLAPHRGAYKRAMSAFRRIAKGAVGSCAPGGVVVLSSCSAVIGIGDVERCLALGAGDAQRTITVFDRVFQGADHPVPPAFTEGLYLSTVNASVE
ncbi:MAG: class I SAM-dependent rRNA methyltransferase [Polyangiaceae bacterium]|nr:class I SAM-dependent rRNA methyltransferase [Polyangiaceae bacterium]